jgi:hypothetical protein
MRDAISPSSAAAAAAGGVSWGRRKGGAPRLAANEGFVLPWLRTEEGRKRDLLRKKWRTSSRGPTCQRLSGRGWGGTERCASSSPCFRVRGHVDRSKSYKIRVLSIFLVEEDSCAGRVTKFQLESVSKECWTTTFLSRFDCL